MWIILHFFYKKAVFIHNFDVCFTHGKRENAIHIFNKITLFKRSYNSFRVLFRAAARFEVPPPVRYHN